jgi:PTS system galactitol-specific IIA component
MTLFRRELCWTGLEAADATAVISLLARKLVELGHARPSLEAAVLAREAASPTGLPLAGRKVAIPHSDPEHVAAAAIAVATLARPVVFRELGNPEQELAVELVALLAIPDAEQAQRELVGLIERLQQPAFVDRLCSAPDATALQRLLAGEEAP